MWREIKLRFMKSLEAVQEKRFVQPFRLAFPATSCAFMIAPLDPKLSAAGPEGEQLRVRGLRNLTDAAMYDTKSSTGVGILISKDEDYIQIDWSLINLPWEPNPEMDAWLAKSYPFREAKEKQAPSFLLRTTERDERGPSGRHAAIVPDGKYAGMWRVKLTDGSLSDMVNLTRAKDAAGLLGSVSKLVGSNALVA